MKEWGTDDEGPEGPAVKLAWAALVALHLIGLAASVAWLVA